MRPVMKNHEYAVREDVYQEYQRNPTKANRRYGEITHSGGLPFSLKRNLPAILLPASAAGIHTGFIYGPPNEIF